MNGPIGIIVDKEDCLWISSAGGRVQRFSREGAFLQGFGRTGTGPGEFNIPHALAVDSRGDLYVTDALNHRVQKFVVSM